MNLTSVTLVKHVTLRTSCDGCGERYTLDVVEDVYIGGECPKCEYYTTRYQPRMEPK